MLQFEFIDLIIIQISWMIFSGVWMLRRNDELPLLLSFLLFYVSGYRYWAVQTGLNDFVNLSQFGILGITNEEALGALSAIVTAQTCLLGAYCYNQRLSIPILNIQTPPTYLTWLRPKILTLGLFCLPLVVLIRQTVANQLRSGRSLAFEISGYLYQFPFVLIGVATLTACLFKFKALRNKFHLSIAGLILYGVASLTFQLSGRFQIIGWMATAAIIFSATLPPLRRLIILGFFFAIAVAVFAIAGSLRGGGELIYTNALDRFLSAEDANMLDGFVLLQRYVPDLVPYRWGMTHFEILMRPIPRAIWPGKPIGGGYMSAIGLSDPNTGQTLGISPTFFGDLYSEGGWMVMLILCVIYGIALAKLVRWTTTLEPFPSILVRGILCASIVPILRGGDMAGIAAWIGMAFWPCFLFLWVKRDDIKSKNSEKKDSLPIHCLK